VLFILDRIVIVKTSMKTSHLEEQINMLWMRGLRRVTLLFHRLFRLIIVPPTVFETETFFN